eukprot:Opistho-2@94009
MRLPAFDPPSNEPHPQHAASFLYCPYLSPDAKVPKRRNACNSKSWPMLAARPPNMRRTIAMTGFDPALRQLLSDPSWLPHRYDERRDAFHLLQVDRAGRAGIPFLTDEHLQGRAPRVVDRAQVVAAAPAAAPVHFIFHSAYCCSTLLARLLDMPGVASTLKEPVFLNDMVGWRHRGGEGRRIAMVLDQGLGLLARPFDAGEAVIIKPSNVVNALIPAMMAMKPDAKALLLYAPLEQYLSSIARKGMWSRLWVRELLVKQLRDGMVQLGLDPMYSALI